MSKPSRERYLIVDENARAVNGVLAVLANLGCVVVDFGRTLQVSVKDEAVRFGQDRSGNSQTPF